VVVALSSTVDTLAVTRVQESLARLSLGRYTVTVDLPSSSPSSSSLLQSFNMAHSQGILLCHLPSCIYRES
jgi:hypothetical protein